MFILLLDNLSEQHQMDMKGRKDLKGRKGQKGKKGQRGEISNKGAKMMLVEEEIHKGIGTQMGMTGTKGIHSTTMTTDQQEVLKPEEVPTEISSKRHHSKTSDQQSRTLGGSPGTMGCSVGSEAKTGPE